MMNVKAVLLVAALAACSNNHHGIRFDDDAGPGADDSGSTRRGGTGGGAGGAGGVVVIDGAAGYSDGSTSDLRPVDTTRDVVDARPSPDGPDPACVGKAEGATCTLYPDCKGFAAGSQQVGTAEIKIWRCRSGVCVPKTVFCPQSCYSTTATAVTGCMLNPDDSCKYMFGEACRTGNVCTGGFPLPMCPADKPGCTESKCVTP